METALNADPDIERDHPHCSENEEYIRSELVGTFHLESGPVELMGYRVRCKVCSEEYVIPVG